MPLPPPWGFQAWQRYRMASGRFARRNCPHWETTTDVLGPERPGDAQLTEAGGTGLPLGAAPLQRLVRLLALSDVAADLHERTPAVAGRDEERLGLDHALHPGRALPASL